MRQIVRNIENKGKLKIYVNLKSLLNKDWLSRLFELDVSEYEIAKLIYPLGDKPKLNNNSYYFGRKRGKLVIV
jgi:hypothetical protein